LNEVSAVLLAAIRPTVKRSLWQPKVTSERKVSTFTGTTACQPRRMTLLAYTHLYIFYLDCLTKKLKQWTLVAEVAASLAVIFSLFLLVAEIRENTAAVERQTATDHRRSVFSPFMSPPVLLEAIRKVKAVDGNADYVTAYMDTYDMTDTEAYAFGNFQLTIWTDMQQDFVDNGPSDRLAEQIRRLLVHPDVKLFLEHFELSEEFRLYIENVRPTAKS
jgi:hypothetical protein